MAGWCTLSSKGRGAQPLGRDACLPSVGAGSGDAPGHPKDLQGNLQGPACRRSRLLRKLLVVGAVRWQHEASRVRTCICMEQEWEPLLTRKLPCCTQGYASDFDIIALITAALNFNEQSDGTSEQPTLLTALSPRPGPVGEGARSCYLLCSQLKQLSPSTDLQRGDLPLWVRLCYHQFIWWQDRHSIGGQASHLLSMPHTLLICPLSTARSAQADHLLVPPPDYLLHGRVPVPHTHASYACMQSGSAQSNTQAALSSGTADAQAISFPVVGDVNIVQGLLSSALSQVHCCKSTVLRCFILYARLRRSPVIQITLLGLIGGSGHIH